MINTVHTFVGWKIGGASSRLAWPLCIAFASHFLFDMVPHLDPIGTDIRHATRNPLVYLDVLLPWLILWLCLRMPPWRDPRRSAIAFAAALPDFLTGPATAWEVSWITDLRPFQIFAMVHRKTHFWSASLPMPEHWLLGVVSQSCLLLVLFALFRERTASGTAAVGSEPQLQV